MPERCRHHTIRRAFRNRPLTETDKLINRHIAKVRCRVEPVSGLLKLAPGVGMARARTNVTLTNLLYNICRFEQIKRLKLNVRA